MSTTTGSGARWVLREDWDTPEFYPSSVLFQKHSNRDVRILDLATGKNTTPHRSTLNGITPVTTYEFVNGPKLKVRKHWDDRRASSRGVQDNRG